MGWKLLGALRLLLAFPVLVSGLFIGPFIGVMGRTRFAAVSRVWYRCLLFALGIRCRYEGVQINDTCLIVSNHISWADILVIGSRYPFTFLAMQEVADWPIVGWLARKAGTLFISRGQGADEATALIADTLKAEQSVIVFPEGRTSTGVEVGKFHSRLLTAAVQVGVPVYPVAVFYTDRGSSPNAGSRVTFADEAGFAAGLWRTVCGRPIDATLRVFAAGEVGQDRHKLSKSAHIAISDFIRFTVDSSKYS